MCRASGYGVLKRSAGGIPLLCLRGVADPGKFCNGQRDLIMLRGYGGFNQSIVLRMHGTATRGIYMLLIRVGDCAPLEEMALHCGSFLQLPWRDADQGEPRGGRRQDTTDGDLVVVRKRVLAQEVVCWLNTIHGVWRG